MHLNLSSFSFQLSIKNFILNENKAHNKAFSTICIIPHYQVNTN